MVDTRGIDDEVIARAGRPIAGDRLEWNDQVCEVVDITCVRNVGDIVNYTLMIDGKVTHLSEFLRNWPTRVEKTILRGAVFVPSNPSRQPRRECGVELHGVVRSLN